MPCFEGTWCICRHLMFPLALPQAGFFVLFSEYLWGLHMNRKHWKECVLQRALWTRVVVKGRQLNTTQLLAYSLAPSGMGERTGRKLKIMGWDKNSLNKTVFNKKSLTLSSVDYGLGGMGQAPVHCSDLCLSQGRIVRVTAYFQMFYWFFRILHLLRSWIPKNVGAAHGPRHLPMLSLKYF